MKRDWMSLASMMGLVMLVLTVGNLNGARPAGLSVVEGEAWVVGEALHLLPGVTLWVGEGTRLELEGQFLAGEVDLISGITPEQGVIGHVGNLTGIFSHELKPLSSLRGETWQGEGSLSLACEQHRLLFQVPTMPTFQLENTPCSAQRLWVRVQAPGVVRALKVDGVQHPLARRGFSWGWLGVGLAIALVLGGALGGGGWQGLLVLPLTLLAPGLTLPLEPLLAGGLGLGLGVKLREAQGWRRELVGVLLVLSVGLGLYTLRGREVMQWPSYQVASLLADQKTVEKKVLDSVEQVQQFLRAHPSSLRQVVALGSSSSGGGTPGRFWPQRVQERLPHVQVVPVTQGGATTWHLTEMMKRLKLKPVLCILYAGHNDNTRSFPGQTIAALMRGDVPAVRHFVAPVSRAEAQENVRTLVGLCGGTLWVMPEYSTQLEAEQVAYGEALAQVPGVLLLDAASRLRASPPAWMLDDVHPSPEGQEVLAQFVLEQLRQRMPALLEP